MTNYKCFFCGKVLTARSINSRFSCPNCGSKVFFKPRTITKRVKAV